MLLLQKIRLYNIKLFFSVFDEVMSQLIKIVKNWTYHANWNLNFNIQWRNQSVLLQMSQQAITIIAVSSLFTKNKTLSRLCSVSYYANNIALLLCDTLESATWKHPEDNSAIASR